jgi:3-hydroxyisobutyrate dehydrogenase-like beta-hydroxyacid dehydrogenase
MSTSWRVALIGYGEVGQVLSADLHARGVREIFAWDVLFADPNSIPSRAAAKDPVRAAASAADAVAGADLVISAVTAAQDVAAAESVAGGLTRGAWFLDLNSVSPEVKMAAAEYIEARGARYVEAAVMSPISPKRIASPMLLGGPHAKEFLPSGQELGFTGASVFSSEVGRASAAKMCRSVMIKGMEALLTESMLAARHYGVESTVLESLQSLFPSKDWRATARYMISRSLVHGRRRAEEMREVAETVRDAGIEPWMSSACAARQDWAAHHRAAAEREALDDLLDAMLAAVEKQRGMPE